MINFYFVGRAVYRQKRIDRFKEFMVLLNKRKIQFNLHFFSKSIPPDFENLSNITFHGYKKNWIDFVDKDFVMLLFSDYEGCPLCILEANKAGYNKFAVLKMPGIAHYVSNNSIFHDIYDLANKDFDNYSFESKLDLSLYFDENRFSFDVSEFCVSISNNN